MSSLERNRAAIPRKELNMQVVSHYGGLFEGGVVMKRGHMNRRPLFAGTIATLAVAAFGAWFVYSSDAATPRPAPPVPQVMVSTPLQRQVESRLGFLGQFSAIEQVELRALVGGTLTGVYFKDGDIVHKGDLLFTIDARPYEIRRWFQ